MEMFTFQNVWKYRREFIDAFKQARVCKPVYKKLVSAETRQEFMQVIYNNFSWINDKIPKFKPKFVCCGDFSEGLASVELNGKWGFINTLGEIVIEPKFDFARDFSEGLASVELNGKWGFINTLGEIVK